MDDKTVQTVQHHSQWCSISFLSNDTQVLCYINVIYCSSIKTPIQTMSKIQKINMVKHFSFSDRMWAANIPCPTVNIKSDIHCFWHQTLGKNIRIGYVQVWGRSRFSQTVWDETGFACVWPCHEEPQNQREPGSFRDRGIILKKHLDKILNGRKGMTVQF